MNVLLLTHERELGRPTNTGAIALSHAPGIVKRLVWERTTPNQSLVKLIENGDAALLYPQDDAPTAHIEAYESFIILDGTWQESRKIINKSVYLHKAPRVTLPVVGQSSFNLRRNQVHGGLCTAECIIELLKLKNQHKVAACIECEYLSLIHI